MNTMPMGTADKPIVLLLSFLWEHGYRFDKVFSSTGLNDKTWSVSLTMRTSLTRPHESPRVYLGRAWNAFAKENGLQMGNVVLFRLRADSTFRVLLCSWESPQRTTTTKTIKGDEDDATSYDAVTSKFAPQHSKSTSNHEDVQILPSGHVNATFVEGRAPTCSAEAMLLRRPTSNVRKREYGNHPKLDSSDSANSQFP